MQTSKLWNTLAHEKFATIDDVFLTDFRRPENANNRLAAWDPFDRSMRYFKFLLFHQILTKQPGFFENYARLGDTSVGNPITLAGPGGESVNLDHFLAVEE